MINKVFLIGRIGQEVETRQAGPMLVASFSIATSESWKDKSGQKQESTSWHNIELWGKLAEVARDYFKKGQQVFIEGGISYQSWDDKEGNKKYKTVIKGLRAQMLGGKDESHTSPKPVALEITQDFSADDIPF